MKNSMKIVWVLFLLFAFEMNAQSCPIPRLMDKAQAVGTYEGIYLMDGKTLPLKMKISLKDDQWSTGISMNGKSMKIVETELCVQEDLHIKVSDTGIKYEFRGKPVNGKMTGRLIYKHSNNKKSTELFSVTKK